MKNKIDSLKFLNNKKGERNMKKISVVGAGKMGAAMSYLLLKKRKRVEIWDRSPEILQGIQKNQESPHLPGIKLSGIETEAKLEAILQDADLLLLAVPSFAIREICQNLAKITKVFPPFLMISKGIERDTSLLPFQVVGEVLGEVSILHITGVGYAQEVDKGIQVTEVLASRKNSLLKEVKELFENEWLTIETTDDLLGTQLAGALKNTMVIGIGILETLKPGLELREKLIAQGVREMVRLGKAMGAKKETFFGPAGKGDLEISADPRSRNYTLGKRLVQEGLEKVKKSLQTQGITVEGFYTATAVRNLAKSFQVELPLVELVNELLEGRNFQKIAQGLLSQI